MNINIGTESTIDYNAIIAKLKGINKVIFVGGISPALEGEEMPVNIDGFKGGDRTNIELPSVQRNFLKALHNAGKTVVYVNCSGSAIALEPETKTCNAILQAWYAGQEGGTAVADVLFGDYNPSGKLPVTFYKSTNQLPAFEDYSMKSRTYRYFSDPLFAFGYGESYTKFNIGKADIEHEGDSVLVKIPVENVGSKEGTEILQVYIHDLQDENGPIKSLRGFCRVNLKAGQKQVAKICLNKKSFEFFDESTNTMRTRNGSFEIMYGSSSLDKDLQKETIKF